MGWVTTKDGRHVNTDWFDRENNIMSNKHDHLNALREAKTKDEVMGVVKSAGNKLTGKALEDVMSAAHDKAQEMRKDEKERQIEANKKEADRKNAEEKQKEADKVKSAVQQELDKYKDWGTRGRNDIIKKVARELGARKGMDIQTTDDGKYLTNSGGTVRYSIAKDSEGNWKLKISNASGTKKSQGMKKALKRATGLEK